MPQMISLPRNFFEYTDFATEDDLGIPKPQYPTQQIDITAYLEAFIRKNNLSRLFVYFKRENVEYKIVNFPLSNFELYIIAKPSVPNRIQFKPYSQLQKFVSLFIQNSSFKVLYLENIKCFYSGDTEQIDYLFLNDTSFDATAINNLIINSLLIAKNSNIYRRWQF